MVRENFRPIQVEIGLCRGCERCYSVCKHDAIYFSGIQRLIDYSKCTGCLSCVTVCPKNAISVSSFVIDEIISIDTDAKLCNACGSCADQCPQQLFIKSSYLDESEHQKIIFFVPISEISKCRGCEICVMNCSKNAINIQKMTDINI